ncbi:hypothetical protein I5L21_06090 [Serratia liquefaciens]|uniref:hypothetical protein n=1 Tax=Serratia liquefaciens TaxID=614 RepID=UPI0018D5CEFF|nr:hypothetical protein [Serratia liquefaciens]MBH2810147.1 hypothetical protein [Serratia liquefaciens]
MSKNNDKPMYEIDNADYVKLEDNKTTSTQMLKAKDIKELHGLGNTVGTPTEEPKPVGLRGFFNQYYKTIISSVIAAVIGGLVLYYVKKLLGI